MNNDVPRQARVAPRPSGLLSGKRSRLRRTFSLCCATVNRSLDWLPIGRWLHRRIRRSLEFSELTLPLATGREALAGLRIAFVSDVHAGSFLNEQDLVEIFRRIGAARPDLVLLGGDLINTRDREIVLFRRALAELRPSHGIFAVPGNHDHFYGSDITLWRAFLEDCGVTVLLNTGVRIEHGGGSLWLGGVDDLTEGEPDLSAALRGRREGELTVLLSHHPDFFFEAAVADVALQLSGHTHGGQIRIAGWAPIHHSRLGYERGWFFENDCRLYVGRGVGVTLLPIRIDARPEVPIVTLRCPVRAAAGAAPEAALSQRH